MTDDENKKPKAPKIRITVAEDQLGGHYANLGMASHSPTEFVLDWAFVPPGIKSARVFSRVLLNPINAKRFAQTLTESVRRYEVRFGEINTKLGGSETLH